MTLLRARTTFETAITGAGADCHCCLALANVHAPAILFTTKYFTYKLLLLKFARLGTGPAALNREHGHGNEDRMCRRRSGRSLLAILMKLQDPSHRISVYERNKADDTFGWGVVLSDETLENLSQANDPRKCRGDSPQELRLLGRYCGIHIRGRRSLFRPATGFCGIEQEEHCCSSCKRARTRTRCRPSRFETEMWRTCRSIYAATTILMVAADGLNSNSAHRNLRTLSSRTSKPDIEVRSNKFVWLGTHQIIRRRLHLHLRGDEKRLGLGPRLSSSIGRHCDLHR